MNKVRQTHIGMKNHNIETYLEMSLEDYLSGKKTSNDDYFEDMEIFVAFRFCSLVSYNEQPRSF